MSRVKPIDKDFVAAKPTKVLHAIRGGVTVISKLYGPVDDARQTREQRTVEYRAEQLAPSPRRPERSFVPATRGEDVYYSED